MGLLFRNTDLNQSSIAVLLELCLFCCLPLCVGQVPGDAVQEVPKLLSGALRETRAWFRNVLKQKLLKEYLDHVTFTFFAELRVCHLLIMSVKRGFSAA